MHPFEYYYFLKRLNRKLAAFRQLLRVDAIKTMPQWVSFQNTHVCNLRCPHCQTHGTTEGRRHCNDALRNMDTQLLERAAKEALPFADEFTLTLTGEPLTTPNLENTIQMLGSYGAKLDLITNGTLLTKRILHYLIPVSRRVQFSFDGATPLTFESIRLGAKYQKAIHNIKLFTMTCALLPSRLRPNITLSYTIMGSNIQELPEMVSLAAYLGIPIVNGAFVQVFYDQLRNESVDNHKSQYNAYYHIAMKRARQLGIILAFPPPFSGVPLNRDYKRKRDHMIINDLPADYDPVLPDMRSFVDQEELIQDAKEIAALILKMKPQRNEAHQSTEMISRIERLLDNVKRLVTQYGSILRNKYKDKDKKIKYCDYLYRTLYVFPSGDVSPCCFGPVLGNLNALSVSDIWNGEPFNHFRKRFFSYEPFDCCKGCKFVTYVYPDRFFSELFSFFPVAVADLFSLYINFVFCNNVLINKINDFISMNLGGALRRKVDNFRNSLLCAMEPHFLRAIKTTLRKWRYKNHFSIATDFLLNLYLRSSIAVCGDRDFENLEEIGACQEFESAHRIMVLNPQHGFGGIRFHQQVSLEDMTGAGLKMKSEGNGPILFLPELGGSDIELSLIIKTEITSPGDTFLRFFWITPENEESGYTDRESAVQGLRSGRNVVFVKIPINRLKGPLRLSPGDIQGVFILHSIEIRSGTN